MTKLLPTSHTHVWAKVQGKACYNSFKTTVAVEVDAIFISSFDITAGED